MRLAPQATGEIARARTLIEQAEKAGAQRYAAVELDQARNKLRLADAAAENGKNEERVCARKKLRRAPSSPWRAPPVAKRRRLRKSATEHRDAAARKRAQAGDRPADPEFTVRSMP